MCVYIYETQDFFLFFYALVSVFCVAFVNIGKIICVCSLYSLLPYYWTYERVSTTNQLVLYLMQLMFF